MQITNLDNYNSEKRKSSNCNSKNENVLGGIGITRQLLDRISFLSVSPTSLLQVIFFLPIVALELILGEHVVWNDVIPLA